MPRNRAAPAGAAPQCANVRAGTPAHPGSPRRRAAMRERADGECALAEAGGGGA